MSNTESELSNPGKKDTIYVRALKASEREIRLLDFEPFENFDDPIRLSLCCKSLDEASGIYNALSYTWENPVPDELRRPPRYSQKGAEPSATAFVVYLNDEEHSVKSSLYFALKQVRPGRSRGYLWVDRLCINQANLKERTEQVRIMGDIYRGANEVLIWLGEEDGDTGSEMAISLLQNMCDSFSSFIDKGFLDDLLTDLDVVDDTKGAMNIYERMHSMQMQWIKTNEFIESARPDSTIAWESVAKLFRRTWWSRIWTYQEKALAQSAILMVGSQKLQWTTCNISIALIIAYDNNEAENHRGRLMPQGEYQLFMDSNMPVHGGVNPSGSQLTLLDRVVDSRRRDCKEPVDRIYAMLNTVMEDDPGRCHFINLIDYERTTQALFTEFSRFYLQDQKNARILQSCTSPAKLGGLPTWVPDWSTKQHWKGLRYQNYHAGGESELVVKHQAGSVEISILGVAIDHVTVLVPPRHPRYEANLLLRSVTEQQRIIIQKALRYYGLIYEHSRRRANPQLEGKWLELANSIPWPKEYITGETFEDAYWRTLMADLDPHNVVHPRAPGHVEFDKILGNWAAREFGARDAEPRELHGEDVLWKPETRLCFDMMYMVTQCRRLFVTAKGFLGLATHDAEEGDLIVAFHGSQVPFLLRKKGAYYIMVGESYVHGFMDGRAVEHDYAPSTFFDIR